MAFSDPQTFNNGSALSLPRVSLALDSGRFQTATGLEVLKVEHAYRASRIRRTVRFDQQKVVSDPLVPASNVRASMSAYIVVDVPNGWGYTSTETVAAISGLCAWLTATSNANATKFVGGEV